MMKEGLQKAKATEEAVLLERKVKDRAKITSKEIVRIRRLIIDILCYVKTTCLYRDANSATNVCSDTLRLMGSPFKKSKKSVGKGSVALLKESIQLGSRCVAQKIGKRMVYRRESFKSVHLKNVRRPCNKKDAPAEKPGTWRNMAKHVCKLKA